MDINPQDSKVSYTSTGTSRYRVKGDVGFQDVMNIVGQTASNAANRADESRRPIGSRDTAPAADDRYEREAAAPERLDDDQRPSKTRSDKTDGKRNRPTTEQQTDPIPVLALVETLPASKPSAGQAAVQTASISGSDPTPAVPASAPAPTPVGAPAAAPAAQSATPAPTAQSAAATPVPGLTATAPAQAIPASAPAASTPPAAATALTAAAAPAADVPPGALAAAATTARSAPASSSASTPASGSAPAPTTESASAQSSAAPAASTASATPTATTKQTGDALRGATVTIEPATVVARTQGVSSAVLVQAHMAAAADGGTNTTALPSQAAGAGQTGTILHVGGGQPLFVGADGGAAQSGAGQGNNGNNGNNAQSGGGQQNGTQTQGNGFAFGAATIGQRGFGGDAARAQFQDILTTRTARASISGPGGVGAATAGTPSSLTTSSMTAGPGGLQSTLPTAMASGAEATAQGRPGALPGTVVGQVAVKLASTAADGGGRVTIRLNPEELGKVDIKLEITKDGTVHARISAERPETLDMLQRDSRALDRALQEAGLKTDQNSLEFDLRGGNGQPTDRDEHSVASGKTSSAPVETTAAIDIQTDSQTGSSGVREDGSYDLVA